MPELPSEQEIIAAIGAQAAGILKDNTPSRICGMLTARGRNPEWEKALEHIAIHFGPASGKATNSRFVKRLQDPEKLKEYVRRAAGAPSAVRLSKKTNSYVQPTGAPVLLILRDFGEPIGQQAGQSWLVIVADYQGRLVTAYPETEAGLRQKGALG